MVGLVGGGQLARMCGEAASALGIEVVVLAAHREDAAADVAHEVLVGAPTDPAALGALADRVDAVTFDHELVDLEAVTALERAGHVVAPSAAALRFAADKAHQRRNLAAAGLPVPHHVVLEGDLEADLEALDRFSEALGHVPVAKAARGGYDGRGVVVADDAAEVRAACRRWRASGVAVVLEERVAFRAELAALLAQGRDGDVVHWRTVRTTQVDGMCREIRVPGGVDDATDAAATALARQVATACGVVGVLAVELFDRGGDLVVNELATRPHNSGHWTIEGAATSQFENHLRAVLGLPLGGTEPTAPAIATVNVVGGTEPGDLAAALHVRGAHVHRYGKAPRPGRKLGHVTVLGDDEADVAERAWAAAAALGTPTPALSSSAVRS